MGGLESISTHLAFNDLGHSLLMKIAVSCRRSDLSLSRCTLSDLLLTQKWSIVTIFTNLDCQLVPRPPTGWNYTKGLEVLLSCLRQVATSVSRPPQLTIMASNELKKTAGYPQEKRMSARYEG